MKHAHARLMGLVIVLMTAAVPLASAQASHVHWDIASGPCTGPGGAHPCTLNPGGTATAMATDCAIPGMPFGCTRIAVATQAALAQEMPIHGPFTVTYVGQPANRIPGVSGCIGDIWIEARGIGQTILGPMFFTVQKCYNLLNFTYAGTFALCLSDALCGPNSKDSISGEYAGADDAYDGHFPIVFGPFHGILTVNAGTGRFGGARGTINFAAMGAQNIQFNPDGTIAGVHEGTAYYSLRGTLSFRDN